MTTPRAAVWADALHLKTTDRARLLALAQPVADFSTPTKRDARVRGDQSPIVCDHPLTEVLDSRRTPGGGIRRRRMCISCGLRVTTYEQTTPIKRPKDRPSASTSANPDVAGLIRDALNAVTTQRAATRSSAARMVMDDVIADLESAYAGIEELREGDERQAA